LGWVGEFVAGPPFRFDVIYDQRSSDAADRTLGEAVPGVGGGKEDQAGVEGTGGAADQMLRVVVDVGTSVLGVRVVGRIDKHGEALGTDVGVWFQPETVGVEAAFDAQ
jgi:hypothetical protein